MIKSLNQSQYPPVSSKAQNQDLNDMDVLCTFKIKKESQNLGYGFIKDQWPNQNQDQDANPSQEPPASSKAPNEHLKDMDVLCTFKIKIESQNSEQWCIKNFDHIQIRAKMPNLSREPTVSFKALNQDLKDMNVLCTFKIKRES